MADTDELTTPLMTDTEHMDELSVQWAGDRGQGATRLTGKDRRITLGR